MEEEKEGRKKIFYFMPDDIKDGKIFRHITAHSINFHQMLPICAIGLNLFVAHPKSLRLSILVQLTGNGRQGYSRIYKNENLHLFHSEMQHNIMSSTLQVLKIR